MVEPAVVRIDTVINYQHAIGAGTGIIIDPGGAILTNFHVVQGADSITATAVGPALSGGPRRLRPGPRHRRAATARRHGGLPAAVIGDSSALAVGDPVVALGNARGSGNPLTNETGTVVGFGRTISAKDELTGSSEQMTGLIEVAAPVRAGDSGGPLINVAGQVVGVTTAATVNFRMGPGGEGFAIPINDALAVAGQIRSRTPIGHRAHRSADPARRRRQQPGSERIAAGRAPARGAPRRSCTTRPACWTVTCC